MKEPPRQREANYTTVDHNVPIFGPRKDGPILSRAMSEALKRKDGPNWHERHPGRWITEISVPGGEAPRHDPDEFGMNLYWGKQR